VPEVKKSRDLINDISMIAKGFANNNVNKFAFFLKIKT